MAQDVDAFEKFLETESERAGIDRELLAAKLCGRWRNGEPLVMRPPSAPAGTIPRENLNAFDYEATRAFPAGDREGLLCPRGSHIRRAFPRSQRVVDDADGLQRRIVRRGMPYDWDLGEDGRERGIVGLFICASLENQFEYVMREWLNNGLFTGGRLGRTKDPITGANDGDCRFVTPGTPRIEARGFPRFVTTRGCAYLFLPSMSALRHIAAET
jgi:deferrochelatase/peroxidase EfeB